MSNPPSVPLALGSSHPPTEFTALLGPFHLQRAGLAPLLAILHPTLPQPYKGWYCYCWRGFRKKILPNVGELSVCGVSTILPFTKIILNREFLWFSSVHPSELLISGCSRLEGIPKPFDSCSLWDLLFYRHHLCTRVKVKRIRSQNNPLWIRPLGWAYFLLTFDCCCLILLVPSMPRDSTSAVGKGVLLFHLCKKHSKSSSFWALSSPHPNTCTYNGEPWGCQTDI